MGITVNKLDFDQIWSIYGDSGSKRGKLRFSHGLNFLNSPVLIEFGKLGKQKWYYCSAVLAFFFSNGIWIHPFKKKKKIYSLGGIYWKSMKRNKIKLVHAKQRGKKQTENRASLFINEDIINFCLVTPFLAKESARELASLHYCPWSMVINVWSFFFASIAVESVVPSLFCSDSVGLVGLFCGSSSSRCLDPFL